MKEKKKKKMSRPAMPPIAIPFHPFSPTAIQTGAQRIGSKTLASRLKKLEKGDILEMRAYNEIPPSGISSDDQRPRASESIMYLL